MIGLLLSALDPFKMTLLWGLKKIPLLLENPALIERWLPRPAEAGECPEGVQRRRRVGVSMWENASSGREGLRERNETRRRRGRSADTWTGESESLEKRIASPRGNWGFAR